MLHKQVEPIFERLNLQCRDESTLQSKLMYGHYLCNSDGDELILYDMHDTKREIEFMTAMDDYKRRSGRQFPTWSEVLEVMRSLGYRKVAAPCEIEL